MAETMKVGVIGGGQLGRMLALAGTPLGMQFIFIDPAGDACARHVGQLIRADYNDHYELRTLVNAADLVTFEFESVPAETVDFISGFVPVYPGANALATARDRLSEKTLFQELDIPIAPIANILSQEDLDKAVADIGVPAVLKTRTLGYDGKGQKVLKSVEDAEGAFAELGKVPLLLEGFIDFDCELSCISVRGKDGSTAFYSLVENEHRKGILHRSIATENHPLQKTAEEYAQKVMDALDYVGVMTFEFFAKGDTLIANEIAPRVHNSGHWTIEGAETSQFENHLRAIAGLPLGSTQRIGHVAMYNLVGNIPDEKRLLAIPGVSFHTYAKKVKPGRKVGHVTVHTANDDTFAYATKELDSLVRNQLG